MRVSNNIHNVACLEEAEFIQSWTEIEKIPVKMAPSQPPPATPPTEEKKEGEKPAEGDNAASTEPKTEEAKKPEPVPQPEQQYETKEKKKTKTKKLTFKTSNFALAPNTRRDFIDFENKLREQDMDILEIKELKNTLEAYSYDMRNNLDSYGSLEKYLEEQQRAAFLKEINEVVDWLYGDGETASKEEYKTRIDKFRKIGDPVKQRHFYYGELDLYFAQFD